MTARIPRRQKLPVENQSMGDRAIKTDIKHVEDIEMVYTEETAAVVESLFRRELESAFQGSLTIDSIRVELTQNMRDETAFHVTVVDDGGRSLLDPAKANRTRSLLTELGIDNAIIESYVTKEEDARRKEFEEA